LPIDNVDNPLDPSRPCVGAKRIPKHSFLIDVPAVAEATSIGDTAATDPIADGIESIRQSAIRLSKLGVDFDGALVVGDGIIDLASILSCIGQVRQGNIKIAIAMNSLLVHLDSGLKLANILKQTSEVGVKMGMS
jgi:hypothetical protein